MDFNIFREIIDQYRMDNTSAWKNVVWLHHFGESLLHPDLPKFVQYMLSYGMKPGISCNPIMLDNEKISKLIQAKPAKILIMFDGYDDDSFFKVRGIQGLFQKSYENTIELLRMAGGDPGTSIEITSVDVPMWPENYDRVAELWRARHGITVVRKPFTAWNGSNDYINSLANQSIFDNIQVNKVICGSPWMFLCILASGDVVVCCSDYDGFSNVGNVYSERLKNIWNGDTIKGIRRQLASGNVTNPLCVNCRYTWHRPCADSTGESSTH
jgi:radical SAM protein with 4Fe4S-binding SPASM domain